MEILETKLGGERMKVYMIFIQDEYNNNYYIGLFKELKNALPDINAYLSSTYDGTTIDELSEYPSTFNYCFDKEVEVDDGNSVVYIRGFILDEQDLKDIK